MKTRRTPTKNTPHMDANKKFWRAGTPSPAKKKQNNQQNKNARKSSSGAGKRKSRRPKRKSRVLMEIKTLQQNTDLLIPKLPFCRLMREIVINNAHNFLISKESVMCLQEAAELYLTHLFEDAYQCTAHRDRITLSVKDLEIVRRLRGPTDPGNS